MLPSGFDVLTRLTLTSRGFSDPLFVSARVSLLSLQPQRERKRRAQAPIKKVLIRESRTLFITISLPCLYETCSRSDCVILYDTKSRVIVKSFIFTNFILNASRLSGFNTLFFISLLHLFSFSNYSVRISPETCKACGPCAESCSLKALRLKDSPEANNKKGKVAVLAPNKCIGCGVCVYRCPTKSLVLEAREEKVPPPSDAPEWMNRWFEDKKAASNTTE
jgi:NAD-dependent dihydropyrimidine dehydrogenase PreA subunit